MRGAHGRGVRTHVVFNLEPHVGARVVSVQLCHVRGAWALSEDDEPWLNGAEMCERGGDRTLPGV